MRFLQIASLLLFLLPSLGEARAWYFDALNGTNANDCATEQKACASPTVKLGTWSTVQPGDIIYLAAGSVFRETMTVGKGGTAAASVTIAAYTPAGRTSRKPIISGSDSVPGFTSSGVSASAIYQHAGITVSPNMVFIDGEYADQGVSAATLNDHEWFWENGILYIRNNSGPPTDTMIEVAQRNSALVFGDGVTNIIFQGIELQHSNANIITTTSATGALTFTDCSLHDYGKGAILRGDTYTFNRCLFSRMWSPRKPLQDGNAHLMTDGALVALTLSYCILERSEDSGIILGLHTKSTIDNCYLTSSRLHAIYLALPGTHDRVRNSVITGNHSDNEVAANYAIDGMPGTTGVIEISNSLVNGFLSPEHVTVGPGVIRGKDPKIVGYHRDALFAYSTDDVTYLNAHYVGDVFRSINPVKFTGTTAAVILQPPVSATAWSDMQAAIDAGDEIASHTRNHWSLISSEFLSGVRYIGAGSGAVLTIGGTPRTLSISVTGTADSVAYDLTSTGYNSALKVCKALKASGKFLCSSYGPVGAEAAADVSGLDIMSAARNLVINQVRAYDYEVAGSMQDLRGNLLAKDRSGPYEPTILVYPYGDRSAETDALLVKYGIQGARSVSPINLDLRRLPIMNTSAYNPMQFVGTVFKLRFCDNATSDNGRFEYAASPFVSSAQPVLLAAASFMNPRREPFGYYVADFRLGNTYVYRDTPFVWSPDYATGSWLAGAYIKPTTLSGKAADEYTIFRHGSDSDSYHRLFLTGDGAAHYEIRSGGVQTVMLSTDPGRFVVNQMYSVAVQQFDGRIQLRYGSGFVSEEPVEATASVTTTVTPANYTPHRFQWAAGWNGATAEKYYQGFMQDVFLATDIERTVIGEMEIAASIGGLYGLYTHGRLSADLARLCAVIMDRYTSGSVRFLPLGHALRYLKDRGSILTEDGLYLKTTYALPADYRPRSDSPLLRSGLDLGYAADFLGEPVTGPISIGPYQSYYEPHTSYTVTFNSNGGSAVAVQTVPYNGTAMLPAPTKTGYIFGGWYRDAGLTTAFNFTTPITTNITLYAKWVLIPTITSFTPASGAVGTSVTIKGTNLSGVTAVYFNGVSAEFGTNTATSVIAVVPAGTGTGPITVTTGGGTSLPSTSSFKVIPTVTSFTPTHGPVGTIVTITGKSFNGATAVKFNTVAATAFTVNATNTQIIATVPTGATTGKISVTTPGGTGASAAVFYISPTITSFSPTSGAVGTAVTIRGTNLGGVTSVKFFNGIVAVTGTNTTISITTTVPAGALTGKISVTTTGVPVATESLTSFLVVPAITGFSPTFGPVGATVVITGTSFTGATAVKFNTVAATAFTVNSDSQITATVPAGATVGKISVTTAGGTGSSAAVFSVSPTITSLSPITGGVGTGVTITGTNFTGATSVKFKDMAAPFIVVSAASIATSVPVGATTGRISVTTAGGTALSPTFTVTATPAVPKVTSFTTTNGVGVGIGVGGTVTIAGNNFVGATAVKFNGTPVTTFTVLSNSSIVTAVPPTATSGTISVTSTGGTGTGTTSFTVGATATAPTITSFTPTSGKVGTDITVTGTNLGGVRSAAIGLVGATFKVRSATSLTITVPTSAVTGKISVTTDGGTAYSATSLTVL